MNNKFYLPGFNPTLDKLNLSLIKLYKNIKTVFNDNVEIGAVYGCPAGIIWNGGRYLPGEFDFETSKIVIDSYNKMKIPVRMTYTNCLLTEEHLEDKNALMLTDYIHNNFNNEILINSSLMEDFLRTNYSNFSYILSTTRGERNVDKINDFCEQYNLVVLNYNDNKNQDILNAIKHKDKIELLVNDYCNYACPYRPEHYELTSKQNLGLEIAEKDLNPHIENCKHAENFFTALDNKHTILQTEIVDYNNKGFYNFKIVGRTLNALDVIESYIYYLIKPQYKALVRYKLISENFLLYPIL